VSLRLFVEINGWRWMRTPSIDDAERAVLAVAAGDWDEAQMADWLRQHLARSDH
jgi:prophage maintenance system killer protein